MDGDHAGKVYERASDASFTLSDLAAVITRVIGKEMPYRNMTPASFRSAGLPELVAKIISDTDAGVGRGALWEDNHALSRLIGRPTTPFDTTITAFLQSRTPKAPPYHD